MISIRFCSQGDGLNWDSGSLWRCLRWLTLAWALRQQQIAFANDRQKSEGDCNGQCIALWILTLRTSTFWSGGRTIWVASCCSSSSASFLLVLWHRFPGAIVDGATSLFLWEAVRTGCRRDSIPRCCCGGIPAGAAGESSRRPHECEATDFVSGAFRGRLFSYRSERCLCRRWRHRGVCVICSSESVPLDTYFGMAVLLS